MWIYEGEMRAAQLVRWSTRAPRPFPDSQKIEWDAFGACGGALVPPGKVTIAPLSHLVCASYGQEHDNRKSRKVRLDILRFFNNKVRYFNNQQQSN